MSSLCNSRLNSEVTPGGWGQGWKRLNTILGSPRSGRRFSVQRYTPLTQCEALQGTFPVCPEEAQLDHRTALQGLGHQAAAARRQVPSSNYGALAPSRGPQRTKQLQGLAFLSGT